MTAWGKRSKVRLHSGGISPSEVRLRRRGSSEKATAPGRDIRDIGPDQGPRPCRICSKPVETRGRVRCRTCIEDESLVQLVRQELKSQGLPPLGATVPDGVPYAKKRRRAEAALARMGKSRGKAPQAASSQGRSRQLRPDGPGPTSTTSTCPTCFTVLPATRRCDLCD